MTGVGVVPGRPELAGAAGLPPRAEQEQQQQQQRPPPPRAAAMSSVASYESLVHAVSGAVVSERAGAARGAAARQVERPWWPGGGRGPLAAFVRPGRVVDPARGSAKLEAGAGPEQMESALSQREL